MRGWYWGYIPQWVVDHFNRLSGVDMYFKGHQPAGAIESTGQRVKGKYYEYMEVLVCEGTHADSIVKRKLRRE